MLDKKFWAERGKEVVEEYRKDIAKALNYLDKSKELFESIAEKNEWYDDITCLVTEAQAKLGTALAALSTWYDEDEEEEQVEEDEKEDETLDASHRKRRGRIGDI